MRILRLNNDYRIIMNVSSGHRASARVLPTLQSIFQIACLSVWWLFAPFRGLVALEYMVLFRLVDDRFWIVFIINLRLQVATMFSGYEGTIV